MARIKSGRIYSIFALPTLYAIVCAVLILFGFHYLLKSKKNRIFWGFLLVLGIFNLILTQSFGGILYLSVGILLYLLLLKIIHIKYLAPVIMVLSLFFFIIIGLRYSEAKKLEPVKLRFSNWLQAVRITESSPFLGVGLGNYESNVSYFTLTGEAKSIYAHNFFLQFVSETGLIFSLFIMMILFFSRKKLMPANHKEKVLYISVFFVLLVYNFFDIGLYFFTAGITFAIILSQIYPKHTGKFKLNLSIVAGLSVILIGNSISASHQKKGEILLNQGAFDIAKNNYEKSCKINPFNYKSLVKLSYIHFIKKNFQESEKYLNRALEIYPYSGFANYLKSKIEFKRNHLFSSLYHASIAHHKNKLNNQYRKWYEYIKNNLQVEINKPGD